MHDALHENSWRVNLVGLDLARLDQLLDLRDGHLARGGHDRVKVARGLSVHEIAFAVAFPGMDDRQIGDKAALHTLSCPIEIAPLLAPAHLCTRSRLRRA